MIFWKLPGKLNFRDTFWHSCSCITLPPHLSPYDILRKIKKKKTMILMKKDLEKKWP
jgi:hypothetical protein